MRQAGIIAAGALYGLQNHIKRLAVDHRHAEALAAGIADIPGLTLQPAKIDTNIVFFQVDEQLGTARSFVDRLAQHNVFMLALGPQSVRAVTHLNVPIDNVGRAIQAIQEAAASAALSA